MKILCRVPKRNFYIFYISTLFQLQVFNFFVQLTDLGSKNPLQLAHSEYQDTKIFGTKVWGGSLNTDLIPCINKYFHQENNGLKPLEN